VREAAKRFTVWLSSSVKVRNFTCFGIVTSCVSEGIISQLLGEKTTEWYSR